MDKIELKIIGMSYSKAGTGAYALILGEESGSRRIPIIIGGGEAQAIAIELEHMSPARPLTHDLFKNFAEIYGVVIKEVIIDNFSEGIFYAKLYCSDSSGAIKEIDSRTSDAVALAIRFGCPIYTYEKVIEKTGVSMEKIEAEEEKIEEGTSVEESDDLSQYSVMELKKMIEVAITKEDYEFASIVQKEIDRREKE
ncbi:MAG: bifunctional nuclease family protein [Bacteroidota bacterium]|nr:bifunctional nuclease family protein [Bacteroidota bacterium]